MFKRTLALLFPIGAAALFAPLVPTAEAAPAVPPVVSGVIACTAIAEAAARLACLDKAAAALKAAIGSGELLAVERQEIRKAQRQAFGLGQPVETPGAPAALDQQSYELVAAGQGPDRHWVLALKDGGRWRLTDGQALDRDPKAGAMVRVSKGALGGYFIDLPGQPGLKANRIN